MAITSVLLPGEFHGQRSLVGHHPGGCRGRQDQTTNTHMQSLGICLNLERVDTLIAITVASVM